MLFRLQRVERVTLMEVRINLLNGILFSYIVIEKNKELHPLIIAM